MAAKTDDAGVPAWLYLVGAVILLGVVMFAPGVIDWVSGLVSDQVVDGVNDLTTTTTTVP